MIILIILLLFELYLILKIVRFFILSPVYLYIMFSVSSIITSIWYFEFYHPKFNLYNFDVIKSDYFFNVIKQYLAALASFNLGIIIYYIFSKRKTKLLFNRSFSDSLFINIKTKKNLIKKAGILLLIILFLYFYVYGKSIIIRNIYLPDVSRGGIIVIKILSFIEAVILGFAYKDNKTKSRLYLFILLLISMGTGSRTVFLTILVYVIIIFITHGNSLKNKIRLVINLIIAFIFLAYLIQFRSLHSHGVYPYLMSLGEVKNTIRGIMFNLYYSLVFGVYVTAKTLQEAPQNWHLIYISLHPLPGRTVGWYKHINEFKLNPFAPYSLHGTIFKMGKIFSFLYFFMTGIIFAYMEKKVRQYLSKNQRTIAFLITLLLLLHIVYGFEYPLRSAFRYIYYSYFVLIIAYLFNKFKFPTKQVSTNEQEQ